MTAYQRRRTLVKRSAGAAGLGVGVIWSSTPFNVTGIVAVPLLDGEDLRVGDPVLQVRVDVKGW
jgi:hypothetical protein